MATAEIKSKATLDASQFNRGLTGMKQGVSGFASGQVRQLGGMIASAFAVGTVVNFAKNTLEAAHSLQEFSNNTNVNVERLQALRLVAERSGSSMEMMDKTLSRLYKVQAEAAGGNKKVIESFQNLGLSVQDVLSMTPDQLFERISQATRGTGEASVQTAAAGNLLGRNYVQLNETMNTVASDGLQAMTDKLRENNEIMSVDSVNSAAALQAAYERAANKVKVVSQNMFVGAIQNAQKTFAVLGAMASGMSWAEANAIADKQIKDEGAAGVKKGGRPQAGASKAEKVAKEIALNLKVDAADSLGKIGGVMGGQTDPMLNAIQAQMRILENIEKNTSKTADAAEGTQANTGPLSEGE